MIYLMSIFYLQFIGERSTLYLPRRIWSGISNYRFCSFVMKKKVFGSWADWNFDNTLYFLVDHHKSSLLSQWSKLLWWIDVLTHHECKEVTISWFTLTTFTAKHIFWLSKILIFKACKYITSVPVSICLFWVYMFILRRCVVD